MAAMAAYAGFPASLTKPSEHRTAGASPAKNASLVRSKQTGSLFSRLTPYKDRSLRSAVVASSGTDINDKGRAHGPRHPSQWESLAAGRLANGGAELADEKEEPATASRRDLLRVPAVMGGILLGAALLAPDNAEAEADSKFTDMPALRGKDYGKTAMRYPDYVLTETGLQYKDLREGAGPTPQLGQMVVIDWDGFTIGYYGRIFEARNKAKGGSFEGSEKDFYRFRVGEGQVIPAFEEAILGMKPGGIRRIVVPPDLGYPNNDFNRAGPKPMTFSGQRALDFVLKNQGLIDKTLLFDIELLRITE